MGISVARFLLKTSQVEQAIELYQECLIFFNSTAQDKVVALAYKTIYMVTDKGI